MKGSSSWFSRGEQTTSLFHSTAMLTTGFGLPEQCELLFLDIISPDISVFEMHNRRSPHAFPVTTKPLVHMGITGDYKNNVVVIKISWCPCEQLLPRAVGSEPHWWHMDKDQVILWGPGSF